MEVGLSLPAGRVIRTLNQIFEYRLVPNTIRCDNGPEFTSHEFQNWVVQKDIKIEYIQPGKPQQNAYIERYNRTVRYGLLNQYLFNSLNDIQDYATRWLNRPGFLGDLTFWENIRMKNTYSPEIRQRAVRLYQEQRSEYPTQWAATVSIASKFGCTPETLRTWIKKFEADLADNGAAADQAQRIKQLERDNKELQRANEILRKAAAFFAQAELDRK